MVIIQELLENSNWKLHTDAICAISKVLVFNKLNTEMYLDIHKYNSNHYTIMIYEGTNPGIYDNVKSYEKALKIIELVKDCDSLKECIVSINNFKLDRILDKLE